MTTSFFANRALVQETGIQTARALDTRLPLAEQLVALHTLQGELERLQYRIREGAPWYQRFGLERNQQLLAAAFPGYAQAANRLVRDVALTICNSNLMPLSRCRPTVLSVPPPVNNAISSLRHC